MTWQECSNCAYRVETPGGALKCDRYVATGRQAYTAPDDWCHGWESDADGLKPAPEWDEQHGRP